MTITSKQKTALNDLAKYLPALAPDRTGFEELLLGDVIEALQTGGGDAALVTALKAGAAVTAAADVTALGTHTVTAISASASSQNATTNASAPSAGYVQAEAVTTANLANALKVSYNAAQLEIADLRARQAENKVTQDNLSATVLTAITLANDLKAKYNALSTAIDAL